MRNLCVLLSRIIPKLFKCLSVFVIIKSVKIVGGCPGNTLAVSAMIEGRDIDEVINKLKGIPCGMRGTSCPDQLSKALEEIKNKMKN